MLVGQCQLSLLCCAGRTLMLVVVVTLFLLVEVPLGVNMSVMIVENTANKALVAEHTRALPQHGPSTHLEHTPNTPGPSSTSFSTLSSCLATR